MTETPQTPAKDERVIHMKHVSAVTVFNLLFSTSLLIFVPFFFVLGIVVDVCISRFGVKIPSAETVDPMKGIAMLGFELPILFTLIAWPVLYLGIKLRARLSMPVKFQYVHLPPPEQAQSSKEKSATQVEIAASEKPATPSQEQSKP